MCNNYEAQLQGVQDDLKAEQAKLRSLDRELKAEKQTIESQKKYIQDLEENLKDAAENAESEVFILLPHIVFISMPHFKEVLFCTCQLILLTPFFDDKY